VNKMNELLIQIYIPFKVLNVRYTLGSTFDIFGVVLSLLIGT